MSILPIILASASPRRRELLDQVGISYETLPVSIDETPKPRETAPELVTRLAIEKSQAAFEQCGSKRTTLGADTVVVVDDIILGKPRDRRHAEQLLSLLSGRSHEVLSAVALSITTKAGEHRIETRVSASQVWFRKTTSEERHLYCQRNEPMDKAGAYAIQGMAAMFISRLEGSYSGVMGLPLFETLELLAGTGISPLLGP